MSTVMSAVMSAVAEVKNSVANPKPMPWSLSNVNSVGEYGRQGDIYITLTDKPAHELEVIKDFNGQLAEGDTQGSRHICHTHAEDLIAYKNPSTDANAGPILYVKNDCVVDHPEHGSANLGAGIWAVVTYQVNFNKQERTRVKD